MNPVDTQKPRSWELGVLCLLSAVAAALRFHAVAARSFWFDEGISVEIARLGWANFARLLWEREANMSLYYLLLRGWLLFGGSEFFIRGLSALIGTATVPLLYALGRRFFNSRIGLVAAGLLTVNAYHIRYSQEARGYALAVCMAVLSALFFADFVQSGGERGGIAWAAVSALLLYCHFYGALAVAAEAISLAIARPRPFNWKNVFRAARWFLYFIFPLMMFVAVRGTSQLNWIRGISFSGLFGFFRLYTGNRGWPLEILFGAAALLAALALWRSWRSSRFSFETWAHVCTWISLAFPVGFVFAVSEWKPLFVARYLIVCLPALILIAAMGICAIRPLPLRILALAALAVLSVQGILAYYAADFDLWREDWRSAAYALLAAARPDDGVIFYPGPGRMSYEFYKSIERPPAPPRVIYPAHTPGQPSALSDQDFLVQPLAEVIESLPEDAPRVWIVADSPQDWFDTDRSLLFLRTWCGNRYHQIGLEKFPGVELILYSK